MPVDTLHPTYLAHERRAQRVRDAVAGTDAMQAGGYLIPPDDSDEARAHAYRQRAQWLGVTGRTHDGMLGAVFRKAPVIELPTELEYMRHDADGSGMSLAQFARMNVSAVLQEGRDGILADYPEAEDGLTQEQTQGLSATLRRYSSENIINWRRDGERLSLVVLREWYDHEIDPFQVEQREQYRVLTIEGGYYVQRVYREGQPVAEAQPRMARGERFGVIPFVFVGSVNNDEHPDKPVLLDLADVNIGHFRNSADLEEASFLVGQPMFHIDIGEMSADEWNQLNPNGITVGSRRGIQTKGGSASMVQAEERNLPLKLMEQKEAQMLAIGARLIEQKGGNETAESVRARSGAENASLSSVAENVSDAIESALEWCALFMTTRDAFEEIVFSLNREFYAETMDAQQAMALIQLGDRGHIGQADIRAWGRKVGIISPERTDDDINDDVQTSGINLGVM